MVVSSWGRDFMLAKLHFRHLGVSRTKVLARRVVWWPGLDGILEDVVKSCSECLQAQPLPTSAPMQPWSWPNRPWSWLHVDFAGPQEILRPEIHHGFVVYRTDMNLFRAEECSDCNML